MLKVELDKEAGIGILKPQGPLSEADFEAASKLIDPYVEEHGGLRGLIIYTKDFPGWESFGALVKHIKFVKSHHQHITKLALVSDAKLAGFVEILSGHFVSAEVKHYPFDRFDRAREWIQNG